MSLMLPPVTFGKAIVRKSEPDGEYTCTVASYESSSMMFPAGSKRIAAGVATPLVIVEERRRPRRVRKLRRPASTRRVKLRQSVVRDLSAAEFLRQL